MSINPKSIHGTDIQVRVSFQAVALMRQALIVLCVGTAQPPISGRRLTSTTSPAHFHSKVAQAARMPAFASVRDARLVISSETKNASSKACEELSLGSHAV